MVTGENRKKTWRSTYLSITNPTWTDLETNLEPMWLEDKYFREPISCHSNTGLCSCSFYYH